jgi:hypothetical protein
MGFVSIAPFLYSTRTVIYVSFFNRWDTTHCSDLTAVGWDVKNKSFHNDNTKIDVIVKIYFLGKDKFSDCGGIATFWQNDRWHARCRRFENHCTTAMSIVRDTYVRNDAQKVHK